MSSLTLAAGAKPAAFKKLTARDLMTLRGLQQSEPARLLAEFPGLAEQKGKGQAFYDHPDYPRYRAKSEVLVEYYPWLYAAWAGEGAPPTPDDILDSDDDELITCLHEVARRNPFRLQELPAIVQVTHADWLAQQEPARPN